MDAFLDGVATIIERARTYVGRTADWAMCAAYFEIGRMIVEREQGGKTRAEYGRSVLAELSAFLTDRFGKGFSETNLKYCRQFYIVYEPTIRQTLSDELEVQKGRTTSDKSPPNKAVAIHMTSEMPHLFKLSWSHYQILVRIKNAQERRFYEIEAERQQWTVRQLQRQYGSSLYERLALSRDKAEVLRLSNEGQTLEKSRDMLKNPLVLEFLGLEERSSYAESELESAIISKLQAFLLELGKGFLFEARQKRFTYDEDSFYVDLVFYNRLLQCYVLIDLKTDKLMHQDLGQMQMYVNYFDRHVKQNHEKPTVGILLCKMKNDSVVELTLPENSNIYAAEYSLYLPDKALLRRKLVEWTNEFGETHGGDAQ